MTKRELEQALEQATQAIAALTEQAAKKPADAKAKTERKLSVTTAREWTGSNTMFATYRSYDGGRKVKRGARLYRDEVNALFSEFGIKPNAEQKGALDAFFAPMQQD